jgi:pimeloyl-ACP methyl ester carboxylesterase
MRASMPRPWRACGFLLACSLIAAGAIARPARAAAQTPDFAPCSSIAGFACSTLQVPLDRQANVPGTITLHLARRLAGAAPSASAVIGLAGGPGQAALPYAKAMAHWIAPALRTRDLIVFDQRGTGESAPLSCDAAARTASKYVERCAAAIGPSRSGYSSVESVADIEAIREALGYEKLVLYGTSYGTKVAEQYAETYPSHVEALVLDSVVPPEGEEPFHKPTFEAVPRVLRELCSRGACRHIARRPVAELARLVRSPPPLTRRSGHRSLTGELAAPGQSDALLSGLIGRFAARGQSLVSLLLDGDLDPALRALMPAAVSAADAGRYAQIGRVLQLASGEVPMLPHRSPPRVHPDHVDAALFLDTFCEDTPFPWSRTTAGKQRLAEATTAIDSIPQSAFYPFERSDSPYVGLTAACAFWPYGAATLPIPGPLPNVPALILSGAQDLRTPTSNARALAAQIPDAQVLVVPFTGHSVLGSDLTGCAMGAVEAFFTGGRVESCRPTRDRFPPTPLSPRSLSGIQPERSVRGKPGRTLAAGLDTVAELDTEVAAAEQTYGARLPVGSSFPGLHGGVARVESRRVHFERFCFVPGVTVNGTQAIGMRRPPPAQLTVGGRAAAHGKLEIGRSGRAYGDLGGSRFTVALRGSARIVSD